MKDIIINPGPPKEADAVIIPVPYETTVSGAGGASSGPGAIIDMMKHQLEDYDPFNDSVICNYVRLIAMEEPDVKNLSPAEMVKIVEDKVASVLDMEKFPIVFGGEHSVTIGVLKAIRRKYSSCTVFQIDAHGDLREDDSDYLDDDLKPGKYAHCCVMRRARDMGFDTVQAGIRELYSGEMEYIRENRLEGRIFQCPLKVSPLDIVRAITTEDVYLTIDVDGFDPSVMPETGTPVAGGPDWYSVLEILKELFIKKNIVGFDIVEVSPFLPNNITAKNAAQLAYTLTGYKFLIKK